MEFLNPAAWYGLLALPLLLVPYLIRRKPQRLVISSLLLLDEAGDQAARRPWGRIHLPWIFYLQLALLALLLFALSEPVFSVRPSSIAIVLDNSASMQTLENGKPRFVLAQEKARSLLTDLGMGGKIDLYVTTPRLEKLAATPFSSTDAVTAINALEPYDLGAPPVDYGIALDKLARQYNYERLYLLTDHPARGQAALTRVISFGQPHGNLAITGFEVLRSSLIHSRLDAHIEVTNFSNKDEKIRIAIKSGRNQVIASRELIVPAGKTATTDFDGIADHPYYQCEIATGDPFLLDNHRFAVAPRSRNLRILGISPRPRELTSLRAIPGVQVDIIAPSEYAKAERAGYDLEIFHFSVPAALPENAALFILPPESSSLVNLAAPSANIGVSNWREPHRLTRYVNFALFRLAYARPLKPLTAGETIIESAAGPLAFAVERAGIRYLTLGFDPLPYLGRDNLPMSIFTLNFLDWFFAGATSSQATGEPIALGSIQTGDLITTPRGDKLPLKGGFDYFSGTFHQGVYLRQRGNNQELLARNLQDPNESDLRNPAFIELSGGTANAAGPSVMFSFWPYLLLVALLLLIIEWFINPRIAGFRATATTGLKQRS